MKKIKITQKQRRIIIVLMSINLFALFVNFFELSPKFNAGNYSNQNYIYLFTDSKAPSLLNQNGWTTINGNSMMYKTRHPNHFWPFTKFYETANSPTSIIKSRFRGIFPDFDHTEFLVYTLIIFGSIFIRKLW